MFNNVLFSRLKRFTGLFPTPPACSPPPWVWWEWLLLFVATATALGLGLANLDAPSLWHDELVHVYVAKSIAETAWPSLPSGNFYPSSTTYNIVLACFVGLFGDGAFWVRLPSVLLSGISVALLYMLCRVWLGRNIAIVAAFSLALSPWHLAWARQARLYELQLLLYLVYAGAAWQWLCLSDVKIASRWGVLALATYAASVLTSFHSILFLGPVGAYAILTACWDRQWRTRFGTTILACFVVGVLSILWFRINPNPVDRAAVFETGLGGTLLDYLRTDRFFYPRFLANNLSSGFLILAFLGTLMLAIGRERKHLYVALAFWVPVLILTFLVGYRRPRFMYFAYPFYVALSSLGLIGVLGLLPKVRRSWLHGLAALLALLFLGRLSISTADLVQHSMETASGAHVTLARRHPQWKDPLAWVRANRKPDDAILTTTFLPVYHYVGHVDNWFPNRYTRWEYQESGMKGLGSLDELKAFLKNHPKGYYIAESARFMMWRWHGDLLDDLGLEAFWVESNMKLLGDVSSEDVQVWAWDFPDGVPD